jgi:curli biogenesis system outer membrane secretion channel CsgG
VSRGGVIRSPEGSFPDSARSEAPSGIMLMDSEKANTFRIQPLDFETTEQRHGEHVISESESGDASPPRSLTGSDYIVPGSATDIA